MNDRYIQEYQAIHEQTRLAQLAEIYERNKYQPKLVAQWNLATIEHLLSGERLVLDEGGFFRLSTD